MASSWKQRSIPASELHLNLFGSDYTLDKELLAAKSSKIASILRTNPHADLSLSLHDAIPDNESMEIIARHCHGFDADLTPENIIRITCVAHSLGMTDGHSPENLLSKSLLFFEQQIIPSWRNCIKALKHSSGRVLQQAIKLGLIKCCVETIISEMLDDPHLLGEPFKVIEETERIAHKPNARRKLFGKSEGLASLPFELYETIMESMILTQIPHEYIAASLCDYARKRVFSETEIGEDTPVSERNALRKTVESLVRMLPEDNYMIPSHFLFRLLHYSIVLECTFECRTGLEIRIGKQLTEASPKDLMIPCYGYAKDENYDTECVKRILKHFYCNCENDSRDIVSVSELIDGFLAEIAADQDLRIKTFVTFANMSIAASSGINRSCDGIYRAVDIYLEAHQYLTETEREELCSVLDCGKMSSEALQHIAQNERLPVRVMVQALFIIQLNLRKTVSEEVLAKTEEDEDERVRIEIEKMGSKVMELEKECCVMRREIQSSNGSSRRRKPSIWKEMKRKFGCGTTAATATRDCNCQVKNKKKKINPT